MKPIIIDMKNLSESTEIYEKKPNPAIVGFIYVLLGITVISLLWMAFSKIDVVAECNGIICNADDLTEVKCNYNARITKVNVTDGQFVQKGEVLLELEGLSNDKSLKADLQELEKVSDKLAILKTYDNFLNSDAETMSQLDSAELDGMTDNAFFEEFQIRKKLFLNQLKEVGQDKIAFSRSVLNEKTNILKEIQTLEENDQDLLQKINSDSFVDGKLVIYAETGGYFYASEKIGIGEVLHAEKLVGRIYPEPEKTFQAQVVVPSSDIGKIREGQEVKFSIGAFPSNEYGTLTGHVRKISTEAEFDQDSGTSFFLVWIDCDDAMLTDKKGESTSLMSGLYCQAKIVTDRKNVLRYVLENVY